MSQKEFMDKYGDDVLSGYILPTPDELEQAEQEEGGGGGSSGRSQVIGR